MIFRLFHSFIAKLEPFQKVAGSWIWLVIDALAILTFVFCTAQAGKYVFQHKHGLIGQYYIDDHLGTPYFSKRDLEINFDWRGRGISGKYHDDFSIRWTGFLYVPADGSYDFDIRADDGTRLYIDDKRILDNWHRVHTYENITSIVLTRGYHPIRLEYFERRGYASVILAWRKPEDSSISVIPTWNFIAREEDLPADAK